MSQATGEHIFSEVSTYIDNSVNILRYDCLKTTESNHPIDKAYIEGYLNGILAGKKVALDALKKVMELEKVEFFSSGK